MAKPQLILPQADARCGRAFFPDRRTADGHRVALEVWNRATGRVREGYRLAAYRCKQCAGFHVAQRPIDRIPVRPVLFPAPDREEASLDDWEYEAPRVHRVALSSSAW
jgi:hypothetical protein